MLYTFVMNAIVSFTVDGGTEKEARADAIDIADAIREGMEGSEFYKKVSDSYVWTKANARVRLVEVHDPEGKTTIPGKKRK